MIQVLKFRLSLLKERLSINSIKDKCLFTAIIAALVVVSKLLVCCVGNYRSTVPMLSILFALVSSEFIFPKKTKERCFTVQLFFDKVDIRKYQRYLNYRGYVYYQLAILYLLFPLKQSDTDVFIISYFVFQSYIFITAIVHALSSENFFASYKWSGSFIICAVYFMNSRYDYIDFRTVELESKMRMILLTAAAAEAIISSQNVGKRNHSSRANGLFRGLFVNNKDVLFAMRSDTLLRPTIVAVFSGVISYSLKEKFGDMLFTNTLSFFFMFADTYMGLLKYENQSYGLLYSGAVPRRFKFEKIRNTFIIVTPVLCLISVPLAFVTSFSTVAIAFLISAVWFFLLAFCFKLTIEKRRGYQIVISEKDETCFLVISMAFLLVFCLIPEFIPALPA